MGFLEDLKFGKTYEKELLNYLDFDNYNMCVEKENFKSWDIEIIKNDIKIYYEVKSDRIGYKTDNMAIEYECNNKPSGITTTQSDYYAYFIINSIDYDLYIIPVDIIKSYINTYKYKKSLNGGDGYKSKFYLFDIKIFKEYKRAKRKRKEEKNPN